jgi:protein SCO1/2
MVRTLCGRATTAALGLVTLLFLQYGLSWADDHPWGAEYFPNVPLTTQDGTTVHFYDDLLKGKAVAINLIYTHCQDACPLETARLAQVQRLLGDRVGKEIFFYSISIDPEHDTPAALKAYAEKFGVGPGWQFLTGKKEDIALIGEKLGLTSPADASSRDGHMPSLMIGHEPTGQWMRNSAVDNPQFLALTLRNFLLGWQAAQPLPSYTEAPLPLSPSSGEYLFRSRCAACHTLGQGDAIGPDLAAVTTRRDRAWLARYVLAPEQMRGMKDPTAVGLFNQYKQVRMPNLHLTPEEVAAVIAYIDASPPGVQ